MRQSTQQRLNLLAQILIVSGLGLVAVWNASTLVFDLPNPGWVSLSFPIPGLLLWLGALFAPQLVAKASIPADIRSYRLVYDAPDGWDDTKVRRALLNLINSGCSLTITWARDGEGIGCWLSVTDFDEVLERLIADVLPAGYIELDMPPKPTEGVTILRWKKQVEVPGAVELCQLEGVEGVYFRWQDEKTAVVAVWGPRTKEALDQFVRSADFLPGHGDELCFPKYVGDNPWPTLPPFPSSKSNPGLAAVSNLQRLAPALRISEQPALTIGKDAEGYPIGFVLPDLKGMQTLQVLGQAAETVVVNLAYQAIKGGIPTLFLDGYGAATALLARRLMREMAANHVLLCDIERPAQSRFRVNPLWLPEPSYWTPRFVELWFEWLRELGVTPGGLGQNAYRHTQVGVILTALMAAKRHLALDPSGLRDALQVPDFLTLIDDDLSDLLGEDVWHWWLTEGRKTSNFDVHLRLGHLRDRLTALLDIPEYRVLWQSPYLNPLAVLTERVSLLWRLPDQRGRLQPYVTSQLLAITSLLGVWSSPQPVLIFLHELNLGGWAKQLRSFPMARLVLSTERLPLSPPIARPSALLLSRLAKEDAEAIQKQVPDVRVSDLRRLLPRRLLLRRGQSIGTLDLVTSSPAYAKGAQSEAGASADPPPETNDGNTLRRSSVRAIPRSSMT